VCPTPSRVRHRRSATASLAAFVWGGASFSPHPAGRGRAARATADEERISANVRRQPCAGPQPRRATVLALRAAVALARDARGQLGEEGGNTARAWVPLAAALRRVRRVGRIPVARRLLRAPAPRPASRRDGTTTRERVRPRRSANDAAWAGKDNDGLTNPAHRTARGCGPSRGPSSGRRGPLLARRRSPPTPAAPSYAAAVQQRPAAASDSTERPARPSLVARAVHRRSTQRDTAGAPQSVPTTPLARRMPDRQQASSSRPAPVITDAGSPFLRRTGSPASGERARQRDASRHRRAGRPSATVTAS